MSLVCGIDVGSFTTLSYVAWLRDRRFTLDLYRPSPADPLPSPPVGFGRPVFLALDVPQGLPARGSARRRADAHANTPTRRLPADRIELENWKAYRGLIEAGVEIFWTTYERGLAEIFGLSAGPRNGTTIAESYPRYVITRLWPDLKIPSKRKAPLQYVDAIWGRLQKLGYTCESVVRPGVDQVDAMLCAVAAETCASADALPPGCVGCDPDLDREARVLREGWIVSP